MTEYIEFLIQLLSNVSVDSVQTLVSGLILLILVRLERKVRNIENTNIMKDALRTLKMKRK